MMINQILAISMPGGAEWVLIILCLAILFFWLKAIIEIATSKFDGDSTKIVWMLIVIFLGIFGVLIYMLAGRQSRL